MDPARMFKESLTSRPELENSQGPKPTFLTASEMSAMGRPGTDIELDARSGISTPFPPYHELRVRA